MHRREVLTAVGGGALLGLVAGGSSASAAASSRRSSSARLDSPGWDAESGKYVLPPLPYDPAALEPHIDAQTMSLHHDIHHKGYVDGLNTTLEKLAALRNGDASAGSVKALSRDLAFHGSGHALHTIFWQNMCPPGDSGQPDQSLLNAFTRSFGTFDAFWSHFASAAKAVEGSGWGLLVYDPLSTHLGVMQAEKHQNLTAWGVVPLLVIDVWEHAYYLRYQNHRAEYVDNFRKIINWADVSERLARAMA
ncbi:MAG: superoxide dismutase [Phycisphaerales bacterium]